MKYFSNSIKCSSVFFKIQIYFPIFKNVHSRLFSFVEGLSHYCSRYLQLWFDFEACKRIPLKSIINLIKIFMKNNPFSFFDIVLVGNSISKKTIKNIYKLEELLAPIPFLKWYNNYANIKNSGRILVSFISPNLSTLKKLNSCLKFLHLKKIDLNDLDEKNLSYLNGLFIDWDIEEILKQKYFLKKIFEKRINVLFADPLITNIFIFKITHKVNSILPCVRWITINNDGNISWTSNSQVWGSIFKTPHFYFGKILNKEIQPSEKCKKCPLIFMCNGTYRYLFRYSKCSKVMRLFKIL